MARRTWEDFPEITKVLDRLNGGDPDDLVILFIPSRDRHNKDIAEAEQRRWADNALDLFGQLYEGATGFEHLKGIYQPKNEEPQYDNPIMIQSLAARAKVDNDASLLKLAKFCQNMGEKLDQNAVGLVVNDVFINIKIHG